MELPLIRLPAPSPRSDGEKDARGMLSGSSCNLDSGQAGAAYVLLPVFHGEKVPAGG